MAATTTLGAVAAAGSAAAAAAAPAAATTSHLVQAKGALAAFSKYAFGHTVYVWRAAKEEAKEDECGCTVMKTIKAVATFFAALVLAPFAAIHHAYVALKAKIQGQPATNANLAAVDKKDEKPAAKIGWFR